MMTNISTKICFEEQTASLMILLEGMEKEARQHRECVILMPEDETMLAAEKTPLDVPRSRITSFLRTRRGWQESCRACPDFNWGDCVTRS